MLACSCRPKTSLPHLATSAPCSPFMDSGCFNSSNLQSTADYHPPLEEMSSALRPIFWTLGTNYAALGAT